MAASNSAKKSGILTFNRYAHIASIGIEIKQTNIVYRHDCILRPNLIILMRTYCRTGEMKVTIMSQSA